jgi:hypothetical protein
MENTQQHKSEAEKPSPSTQPPLDLGLRTEPKHTEAAPLKPMGK